MSNRKPKLSFWQIWNMSFGFLGIQFGFALQGGFMSKIFLNLGAEPHDIPGLWIAAPLAGLIVQPIIGYMSDRTWSTRFGRRKPYFLAGAILASIALFFMPYSPLLWVAAGALLMLDASINISMEPFRALVADKLDESQRSYGFLVQTLIIGIGTWVASQLPRFITSMGVSDTAPDGVVASNVKIAFGIGAVIFLLSILYTIFTTDEYPPEDLEAFEKEKEATKGFGNASKEIINNIIKMPTTMIKLGVIQFFSWFAFFTMWSMATPTLTSHVYHTPSPSSSIYEIKSSLIKDNDSSIVDKSGLYDSLFYSHLLSNRNVLIEELSENDFFTIENAIKKGESEGSLSLTDRDDVESVLSSAFSAKKATFNKSADLAGSAMGTYGLSSMLFAFILSFITSRQTINRKFVHMGSLILGGLGFFSMYFASTTAHLNWSYVLIGISWGSILSLPYAMLSSSIDPKKMGVFMGLFNMFIVIPQIVAAVGGINLLSTLFGAGDISPMLLAGTSLIIAGLLNILITNKDAIRYQGDATI